jgi:predicted Zn-dependent protease with MMP-like domain
MPKEDALSLDELMARADEAYAAARLDEAERLLQLILRRRRDPAFDPDLEIDALLLMAWVYYETDRDDLALGMLARVREFEPAEPDALYLEARLRLDRWELDAAEALLVEAQAGATDARMIYLRAMLADIRRDFTGADRLYDEANQLDAEECPRPVRMTEDETLTLLRAAVGGLPAAVVETFENLTIDLRDVPDAAAHRDVLPDVLGLYAGVPIGEKAAAGFSLPDRITIFQRNIERLAHDPDHLREQLRITLLHEIGHHLGWDEHDLEARGLG